MRSKKVEVLRVLLLGFLGYKCWEYTGSHEYFKAVVLLLPIGVIAVLPEPPGENGIKEK